MEILTILSRLTYSRKWKILNKNPQDKKKVFPFRSFRYIFLVLFLISISGCVTLNNPENSQEYRANQISEISPTQWVGQSFVSNRPRFTTFQIWLKIQENENIDGNNLFIDLFAHPEDQQSIAHISIPFSTIRRNFPYTVVFDPQSDLPNQSYFVKFSTDSGTIIVYGRNEDQYPQGEFWVNGVKTVADMAFRSGYDYNLRAVLQDSKNILAQLKLLILCILVVWLPGKLILTAFNFNNIFDWGTRIAITVGISLSIIPIFMLWTTYFHIRLNEKFIWIICVLLVILLILFTFKERPDLLKNFKPLSLKIDKFNIALLIVFAFTLFTRFVMVRDLATPAWVDSVHHALLTKLILTAGGYPNSYEPFINIQSANYHMGFHSLVSVFIWLSNETIPAGLLFIGQFLNALVVFATYAFTLTFTRDRVAGIMASLIPAFFTPMPAYYTSWGRYTQLTALLILPAAFILLVALSRKIPSFLNKNNEKTQKIIYLFILSSICCAGVIFTHYRVGAFLLCLIISFLLVRVMLNKKEQNRFQLTFIYTITLFLVALLAFIITVPWWPNTISSLIMPGFEWQGTANKLFSDFSWTFINSGLGKYSLVLTICGIIWGIVNKRTFPWILISWIFLMFFLSNLGYFGLPGSGFINNTSVTISLFLPISISSGYLLSWIVNGYIGLTPFKIKKWVIASFTGVTLILILIGSRDILKLINPVTVLSRENDLPAMEWINKNVPANETFLINPFSWGYGLYAGGDGGYWIGPTANHPTTPPPVLYGLDASNSIEISKFTNRVISSIGDADELYQLLKSEGINYVYIGAKGGALSPTVLINSPDFNLIYNLSNTYVFKIR